MKTEISSYRNSSFLLIGLVCFMMLAGHIIMANTPHRSPLHEWVSAVNSLTIPILCFWIGGLLRTLCHEPKKWIQWALIAAIPVMYLLLVLFPGYDFYRLWPGYDMLVLSLVILGFLLLPVADSVKGKGWLALVLFLASAFCYVGIVRVSDHFSLVNFTLRESEWTTLFTRLIKVVPLVMSLFFLMTFSLSEIGQKLGGKQCLKWTAIALALISGIYLFLFIPWILRRTRFIYVHPLTVFLVTAVIRIIRGKGIKQMI